MRHVRSFLSSSAGQLCTLVLLAGFGMFGRLGTAELQPMGSSIHAAVAREILRTGDWLTLHWPHSPEFPDFYQFPPLFFWLQAIVFGLFGANDVTAKVVSSFFGFATILLTWIIGRLLAGRYVGFLAALTMVLTSYFFRHARKCELETILVFFVALGFLFVILAERRNPWYLVLAGVSAGLGMLAKGPPAAAVWGGAAVYCAATGRWRRIFSAPFVCGVAATVAVTAAWVVPQLVFKGDALYRRYWLDQIVWSLAGRSAHPTPWERIAGYLYFVPVFLTYYQPWSTVGIFGAVSVVRERIRSMYLLLSWAAIVWLGFTVAGYRDDYYLLALWPAWTVLAGFALSRWMPRAEQGISRWAGVAAAVFAIAVVVFPVRFDRVRNPEFRELGPVIAREVPPGERVIPYALGRHFYYYDLEGLLPWYADRGSVASVHPDPRSAPDARAWRRTFVSTPEELRALSDAGHRFVLLETDRLPDVARQSGLSLVSLAASGRFTFARIGD